MIEPAKLLETISEDEEVMVQTKALALAVLDEAMDLVQNGSPQMKQVIIRALMPALAKGLGARNDNEEMVELRKQMAALMTEVRGPGPTSVSVHATDATHDHPH